MRNWLDNHKNDKIRTQMYYAKQEPKPDKYLEVEVTRTQTAIVYLRVPHNFDMNKIKRNGGKDSILSRACVNTLSSYDWDDTGWENDVGWNCIKEVPEHAARAYDVYEVKP
jgi:hypothetical protein